LTRNVFPLAAGSQHIKNAVEDAARLQTRASGTRACRYRWKYRAEELPQIVRNLPYCGQGDLVLQCMNPRKIDTLMTGSRPFYFIPIDLSMRFKKNNPLHNSTKNLFWDRLLVPSWPYDRH